MEFFGNSNKCAIRKKISSVENQKILMNRIEILKSRNLNYSKKAKFL